MAGTPVLKGIKDSWSLLEFARQKGMPKRAELTSKEGENFAALMFPTPDANGRDFTMVSFSSNLGELSVSEVVARKNDLQIVQLESGSYILCRKGEGGWEEVQLF